MSPPPTIRPLQASDHAQWRVLWTAYLEFYGTTLPATVHETTWARLMAGGAYEPRGLVAVEGQQLIGLVHYLFQRTCWRVEHEVYLQDLFTTKAARGKGVGRALINAVYAAADAAGCPSVYWLTQEFNYPGRILYDQVGTRSPFIVYDRKVA